VLPTSTYGPGALFASSPFVFFFSASPGCAP